ncbi:MAG: crossover junction endodeoxyribonuclease RuvC [Armatimonadota bacterium]|nr:crossover junction endodeoxyribonuclease RuvC [Armatimonadota bacterium]
MRILGVDPGTAITGYGILDQQGSTSSIVDYGTISTSPRKTGPERLVDIYRGFNELVDKYAPDVVVMERLFFSKNQRTAMAVGKACGVVQFAAAQRGLDVVEYTPKQVKQAVVGYGMAEKRQVQYMVQRILGMREPPSPDDAADALALCICHAHSVKIRSLC